MNDIIVHSAIDFKTYLNIAFRATFKMKTIIIILIIAAMMEVFLYSESAMDWESQKMIFSYFFIYLFILLPALLYLRTKTIMKKSASLNEPLIITFNEEQIEVKGETFCNTNNWKYVSKLIEKEKYFLMFAGVRAFHYLPKDGFQSKEETEKLKNIVREKGIKLSYKF